MESLDCHPKLSCCFFLCQINIDFIPFRLTRFLINGRAIPEAFETKDFLLEFVLRLQIKSANISYSTFFLIPLISTSNGLIIVSEVILRCSQRRKHGSFFN